MDSIMYVGMWLIIIICIMNVISALSTAIRVNKYNSIAHKEHATKWLYLWCIVYLFVGVVLEIVILLDRRD